MEKKKTRYGFKSQKLKEFEKKKLVGMITIFSVRIMGEGQSFEQ